MKDEILIAIEDGGLFTKFSGGMPIKDVCKFELNANDFSIYHSIKINRNGMVNVSRLTIPYSDLMSISF